MDVQYSESGTGRGTVFFVGLVCGAAVGAVAGLLLAPKSGAELRGDLVETTGRLRRRVMDASSSATEAIGDMVERGRKAYSQGREAARHVADAARGDVHAGV